MKQAIDLAGAERIELTVTEPEAGVRLDKLLAQRVEALSRARIQGLIRAGHVRGPDGATIGDGSYRVKPGETYELLVPEAEPAQPAAEAIDLDVVYEDRDVIVVDKPAHLVVHPGAGHSSGTLVNALIAHCGDSLSGIGGVKRPGIVHRLDKGTSGLLVVAKNDAAHQSLSDQFAAHGTDGRMHRAYLALVWGKPLRPRGAIAARLQRSQANRTKIAVAKGEAGRHATTHYEVLDTFDTRPGRCRCCDCNWRPAARIKFACTWRTSDIRCSATRPTAATSRPRRGGSAKRRRRRLPRSVARRCTPPS